MDWGKKDGDAPQYERLRVAIGDGDPAAATEMKDALHARGVIEVIQCYNTERLFRALDDEIVDLLIYDYHMLDERFVEVMQRIRRKEVGQNPFVTIIATIRDSKAETVRRLIDAGVDDLIRVPISIDRVFESIGKSARRRRPFIVSYDYTGPARPTARNGAKPADTGVKVPNTLKSRAFDGLPEDEIRAAVEQAVGEMVAKQLETCGVEIDRLVKRVADNYASVDGSDRNVAMRGTLDKVATAASNLQHRVAGTSSERVSDLAATLIPITQRILEAPQGRAAIEVQLLSQLATAVRLALSVDGDANPTIRQITDTVGSFAQRPAENAHLHVA
jgi:DNA-binding response OmpR family regulator